VAAYPSDGTVLLDYPFVRLPKAAAAEEEESDAAEDAPAEDAPSRADLLGAFEASVRDGAEQLAAAGFRGPDGTGALDVPGLAAEAPPAQEAKPDAAAQLEILRA